MESAKIASSAGSIHTMADRIAAWAEDHPEASEYCLGDEPEARELLVLIAATFKVTARGTSSMTSGEKQTIKRIRKDMLKACAQQKAMDYVRDLNKTDQLEFLGLRITTPAIVLQ